MARLNPTSTLSWDAQLDKQIAFLEFCISSSNTEILHSLVIQHAMDNRDHTAAIYAHSKTKDGEQDPAPSAPQQLGQIGIDYVNGQSQMFTAEMGTFQRQLGSGATGGQLMKALESIQATLEDNSTRTLREAKLKAKTVIGGMDQPAHLFAARLFVEILTISAELLDRQRNGISDVDEAVRQSKDIPAAVKGAYEMNRESTNAITKRIQGLAFRRRGPTAHAFEEEEEEELGDDDREKLIELGRDVIDGLADRFKKEAAEAQSRVRGGRYYNSVMEEFTLSVRHKIIPSAEDNLRRQGESLLSTLPSKRRSEAKKMLEAIAANLKQTFEEHLLRVCMNLASRGNFEEAFDAVAYGVKQAKAELAVLVRRKNSDEEKSTVAGHFALKWTEHGWKVNQTAQ